MTHADVIVELLDDAFPGAYCDDCLSRELGIEPRQQVNQIAHKLATKHKIIRQRGHCASCTKIKTINALIRPDTTVPLARELMPALENRGDDSESVRASAVQDFDIEHARTEVVRICHAVWKKHRDDSPPHSISVVINALKYDDVLPPHQANMMLTLCNLRNVHVYDNMQLGPREITIARDAFAIIQEWWGAAKGA